MFQSRTADIQTPETSLPRRSGIGRRSASEPPTSDDIERSLSQHIRYEKDQPLGENYHGSAQAQLDDGNPGSPNSPSLHTRLLAIESLLSWNLRSTGPYGTIEYRLQTIECHLSKCSNTGGKYGSGDAEPRILHIENHLFKFRALNAPNPDNE